ncbi:MAG: hypothetical protein BGO49_04285 [Planctomycetales bacterium 71-10]|nr:MAG: hypothetical protein BGO49_04285 [Planctomycetales bacterium 71-10]
MSGRRYEYFEVGASGRYGGVGEVLAAAELAKRDGVATVYGMPIGGSVLDYEVLGCVRRRDGVVELTGVEPASLGCCPHCGCIDVDPLDEGWDELVCTACGVTWSLSELLNPAEGPGEGGPT